MFLGHYCQINFFILLFCFNLRTFSQWVPSSCSYVHVFICTYDPLYFLHFFILFERFDFLIPNAMHVYVCWCISQGGGGLLSGLHFSSLYAILPFY